MIQRMNEMSRSNRQSRQKVLRTGDMMPQHACKTRSHWLQHQAMLQTETFRNTTNLAGFSHKSQTTPPPSWVLCQGRSLTLAVSSQIITSLPLKRAQSRIEADHSLAWMQPLVGYLQMPPTPLLAINQLRTKIKAPQVPPRPQTCHPPPRSAAER